MTTARTSIEDCTAFIGTSQLLCIVPHFFLSALFASLPNCRILLNVLGGDCLYLGSLGAQRWW